MKSDSLESELSRCFMFMYTLGQKPQKTRRAKSEVNCGIIIRAGGGNQEWRGYSLFQPDSCRLGWLQGFGRFIIRADRFSIGDDAGLFNTLQRQAAGFMITERERERWILTMINDITIRMKNTKS